MRFLSVDDYVGLTRDQIQWWVHGLVPKPGKVLVLGAPKAGKSFLLIDLANHIASGKDFLGHKTQQGRVLYFQVDTGETAWRDMLRQLIESGVRFDPNLALVHPEDVMHPMNIQEPATRHFFKRALDEFKPDVVILDTIRKVHNGDENDSTEMKIVMDHIEEIFGRYALILVHHTKKIPADVVDPDPASVSRGSNFLTGDVDSLWLLYHSKLKIDSRFDEVLRYKLAREENGLWSCPELDEKAVLLTELLALCAANPTSSHAVLAKMAKARWGISRAKFYRQLAGRPCVHVRRVSSHSVSSPPSLKGGETVETETGSLGA
jgi:hypothetical protein